MLLFIFSCAGNLLAQDHLYNKVWMMADNVGIDFNSGVPIPIAGSIKTLEGVASATGPDGKLLFYTDGSTVWNSQHQVMTNGTDLAPFFNEQDGSPTNSTTQAAVIVPMPDSSKYYIFSLTHQSMYAYSKLFYTVIDMKLNNCLGGVEPGRKGILLDEDRLSEKMTAVRGNDCNIWVVLHDTGRPIFKSYEVTAAGVNRIPVVSNSGNVPLPGEPGYYVQAYASGVMKISPDRTMLALINYASPTLSGPVELHSFDAATGKVSNCQVLDNLYGYGACFSPDNSKVYFSFDRGPLGEICQFDLSLAGLAAIRNSKTIVTDVITHPQYLLIYDMQIGPDNKIYVGGSIDPRNVNSLYYLNNPNAPGTASQFTGMPFAWPGGYGSKYGKPNAFPVLVGHDTLYSSTIVKINGCTIRKPVPIDIPDGRDMLWNGKSFCSPPEISDTGVYILSYLAPGCIYHIDTFIVPSVPVPVAPLACATPNNFATVRIRDVAEWEYNWLNAAGATIRSYTGSSGDSIKNIATGNYSVKLKNNDGCDTSIAFSIKAPPVIAFMAGKMNVCAGDTIHFTSVSSTEPINTYRWNFGDGTTANEKDPYKIFAIPGSYEVVQSAIGDNGCNSNQPVIKIVVAPLPNVNAGPDQAIIAGTSVVLEGTSTITTPDILWQPSDHLSANNILQPLATPPATQFYYLSVTTEQGCTAFDTVQVKILEKISVPNAFSPNNDGINDRWEIPGLNGYTSSQVSVFNRWGQQVFRSSGYNVSWDGRYNGKPLPVGTYYYMIDLKNDRAAKPFQGTVTIIR